MSGFDLVPVAGGDPVHLPPGETVLGRGPLLGLSDKRVSRSHALLENLDGRLRLKPTHVNPCFVQASLTSDPRPLQRDMWFPLRHGDLFSLLPGLFVYQVTSVGDEDKTPRNSQMFEEEDEAADVPVSPRPDVEPPAAPSPPPSPPSPAPVGQERGPSPALKDSTPAAGVLDQERPESPDMSVTEKVSAPPLKETKRRVLPAWMMSAVSGAHTSSSSPKVQSIEKRSKAPAKRAAAKQEVVSPESSPEGVGLSEQEMPKKKRRKKTSVEERKKAKASKSEISDESDGSNMEVDEEGEAGGGAGGEGGGGGGGGGASTFNVNTIAKKNANSQPEDEGLKNGRQTTNQGESAPKPRLRTPCPYGKDCYRKNPLHFQESSHPGDTDYEEEEEEEEAQEEEDRPECPYGTDCYRKNPLHRKEFKHTKKPASSSRRTINKQPRYADDDHDDDEDEDEYDNSFINDDSDDLVNDSDYEPPDSDDDGGGGGEDIKRLQREAKAFLQKKK